MKFDFEFIEGRIRGRVNRFTASVAVNNKPVLAHILSSGRLTELLQPGLKCYLREVDRASRLTSYDLILVEYKGTLVCINAMGVNRLLVEAISDGKIPGLAGYDIRTEYSWGNSRFDILLTRDRRKPVLIEAKSVTLCEDGTAIFPDAPTQRGVKHLRELERAAGEGYRSYAVFIAQRFDASIFRPNWATDPLFSGTLLDVSKNGVRVSAYKCRVSLDEMYIAEKMPVRLSSRVR